MASDTRYVMPFPLYEAQIASHCWGPKCGKGHVGAIDLGPSMAIQCAEADCPIEDAVSDDIGGGIRMRKLRDADAT